MACASQKPRFTGHMVMRPIRQVSSHTTGHNRTPVLWSDCSLPAFFRIAQLQLSSASRSIWVVPGEAGLPHGAACPPPLLLPTHPHRGSKGEGPPQWQHPARWQDQGQALKLGSISMGMAAECCGTASAATLLQQARLVRSVVGEKFCSDARDCPVQSVHRESHHCLTGGLACQWGTSLSMPSSAPDRLPNWCTQIHQTACSRIS